jgi:hypothetical protein
MRFSKPTGIFVFLVVVACFLASLLSIVSISVLEGWSFSASAYTPPTGNWTFNLKPGDPMQINASQIRVGANWTYVYTLAPNRTYHVYCYGEWIDAGSEPETDYDVYVYDPFGVLVGYHTEAAGLPEHLGSSVDEPFFTPEYSGNYSFVVRNDPRESTAAGAATFMVIEQVEPNEWHSCFVEGKNGSDLHAANTTYAVEFVASSEQVEVAVEVPDTLDMYEARLYLMANPATGKGDVLNGVPLAWELGLFGESSGVLGGYSLESDGFRGPAYASCEDFGQDMLVNYSEPSVGDSLYHLVLIGEAGAGTVRFRVKTDFGNSALHLTSPFYRVYPENETVVTAVSSNSDVDHAFLHFSVDNWANSTSVAMAVTNRTCDAIIPRQEAGTTVNITVEAYDYLENVMRVNGSYAVKHASSLNVTLGGDTVTIGDNASVTGFIRPAAELPPANVTVTFMAANGTVVEETCLTEADGNFSASVALPFVGAWSVEAAFPGDGVRYASDSARVAFTVAEPSFLSKYSMYIAGAGVSVMVLAVVVVRRRR